MKFNELLAEIERFDNENQSNEKCYECGKAMTKKEFKYYVENTPTCCSGHECGCMGMPTEPPYCFECIIKGLLDYNNRLKQQLEEQKEKVEIADAIEFMNRKCEQVDCFMYVDSIGQENYVPYDELIKWYRENKEV